LNRVLHARSQPHSLVLLHPTAQPFRPTRIHARQQQEEPNTEKDVDSNNAGTWIRLQKQITEAWASWTWQQQLWAVTAGLAALVLLPRLLLLVLLVAERALVGGLMVAEEAATQLLFKISSVSLAVGVATLIATGLWVWLGPKAPANSKGPD